MTTFSESDHPRDQGGKFATKALGEAEVDLSVDNSALVDQYLGEGLPLTEGERRLLDIFVKQQPDSDDLESALEELESHGWDDGHYGAQQIADALYNHYSVVRDNPNRAGDFSFGFDSGSDGEVGSYTIGCYLGYPNGFLVDQGDPKHLDPGFRKPEQSGLRNALEIAVRLDGEYKAVLDRARRLGLVPSDATSPNYEPDLAAARSSTVPTSSVNPATSK